MPGPAAFDDASVEAFLSGRPVDAGELGPLAAFVEDVRAAVDGPPPVPSAEMAKLLTEGIRTPTGAPRAALAPSRANRGAHVSKRRKPMLISELLAGLVAKLAGLGAASKAALGLGVAAASVTGAGVAGVLPDPAQHTVAKVVSAATPFEFEDPGALTEVGDTENTPAREGSTGTDGENGDDEAGVAAANHGACVSEVARNAPRGPGGEHGRAVSTVARSDCGKTPATTTPSSTTTSVPSTTTTTTDDEISVEANRGRGGPGPNPGNRGSSGPGSSGNGSSGPGSSGNGSSGPGSSGPGGGQGHGRSGK